MDTRGPEMAYAEYEARLAQLRTELAAMTEQRDQWRRKHEVACDTLTTVRQERSQYIGLLKRSGAELKQREADCAAIGEEAADEFNRHHAEMLALLDQKDAELAAVTDDRNELKLFRWQQGLRHAQELAATQLQLKEAREIAEIIQRKADNSSKETCQLHMFDIATLATLILSRPADTSALDRLLAEKDARIKEAREALDSYDFKVFRRQQPKDVIDHICYNINRRWSEDLVSPWIVEAVISGLFYSAKSEADELFSRPADTTALNRYVAEELRRIGRDNNPITAGMLFSMADELEGE